MRGPFLNSWAVPVMGDQSWNVRVVGSIVAAVIIQNDKGSPTSSECYSEDM